MYSKPVHRFNIFIKSKKFKLDIDLLLLGVIILMGISAYIFKLNEYLIKLYGLILIICVVYFTLKKVWCTFRPQKPNGIYQGFLEFHNYHISVDGKEILLSHIDHIEIINNDFYGLISQHFSAGVNNSLTIFFKDATTITVMFEM